MKTEMMNLTREEVENRLANASSVVKLMCGVCNNVAYLVMIDAHERVKGHPRYRQQVKRLFKEVFREANAYERNLKYARGFRFFDVDGMPAEVRKKYGNITDSDYFDFWQGLGGAAYMKCHPLITSLQNKFRLSLLNHGIKEPETAAWLMTAQAALDIAARIYEDSVKEVAQANCFKREGVHQIFKTFSMKKVADMWYRAVLAFENTEYRLEPMEERNIALGIDQLIDAITSESSVYSYAETATMDFEEIFRTKGEWKKALRKISEAKQSLVS